jgi:hypothetical protein
MLRRLALLVALFSPVASLAQTTGQVLITPSAFGTADCNSTTTAVTLAWNSSGAYATGDFYRVYVNNASSCPTATTPVGTQLGGGDIPATSATGSYPTSGTLTSGDFLTKAGITSCAANATVYVCVQHFASGATTTAKATATGSAKLEVLPPPVPQGVTVGPGDSALFVSWVDGTKNPDGTTSTVTAASYNVTAVGSTGTVTKNSTGRSYRLGGLTNGVTYGVTVTALSAGGNESGPSASVPGTPQLVNGFWEQYKADQGVEQGGCAGGPAGVISLLGMALAMRSLRRRS